MTVWNFTQHNSLIAWLAIVAIDFFPQLLADPIENQQINSNQRIMPNCTIKGFVLSFLDNGNLESYDFPETELNIQSK